MATPRTLLALVPALFAATLAAQSPGGRVPFAPATGAPAAPDLILPAPARVPTYKVIVMPTLSEEHIVGTAFDLDPSFDPSRPTSNPVMVGGSFSPTASGASVRAVGYFLLPRMGGGNSGVVLDLGVGLSQAHGLNSHGTVVGYVGTKAFRFERGSLTILPGIGFGHASATAVNANGIVVGSESRGWGNSRALFWTPDGRVHELPTGSSEVTDINDENEVVGYLFSGSAFTMKIHGLGPTLLPAPLLDTPCWAEAINDVGDVVGEFSRFGALQPVLWSRGEAIPLPVIPNEGTGGARAIDINNHGVIVGSSNWGKAVVWIGGEIHDLNELTPDYEPFLKNARAINDQGVIACESDDGATRAVLLIPNP